MKPGDSISQSVNIRYNSKPFSSHTIIREMTLAGTPPTTVREDASLFTTPSANAENTNTDSIDIG